MSDYKLKDILEILNDPIFYPLDELDKETVQEYLYPKSKIELNDLDKQIIKRIGKKYKDQIDKELEMRKEYSSDD